MACSAAPSREGSRARNAEEFLTLTFTHPPAFIFRQSYHGTSMTRSKSDIGEIRRIPSKAGAAFRDIVPEDYQARLARILARSINAAHKIASTKWGLRLHKDSVMLKVGRVEVLQFFSTGWIGINVKTNTVPKHLSKIGKLSPPYGDGSWYKSLPGCSRWVSDFSAIGDEFNALFPSLNEAIGIASESAINPTTAATHSPGLIDYISLEIRKPLPQPDYELPEYSQNFFPDELPHSSSFEEGAVSQVLVNRYERDPRARALCVRRFGAKCFVCEMSFAETYGPTVSGLIHVHHLRQLARHEVQEVDPVQDLRPVCPNCHAVIHFSKAVRTIEDVRAMLRGARKKTQIIATRQRRKTPPGKRAASS